jgi:hypothetical protein
VLATLGAPRRHRLRGRRGRSTTSAEPAPVPTTRVTFVRAEPFDSPEEAEGWLAALRREAERAESELGGAVRELNGLLRAHRAAAADPHARDVSVDEALAVRIGYGRGDQVAEGRFAAAWEPPRAEARRRRREALAPEQRFAAILAGRERVWACEELVLRARADLEAARPREAALQARVALESLLAELDERAPAELRAELESDRVPIGEAANAALSGDPPELLQRAVAESVGRMESVIRRRRLA